MRTHHAHADAKVCWRCKLSPRLSGSLPAKYPESRVFGSQRKSALGLWFSRCVTVTQILGNPAFDWRDGVDLAASSSLKPAKECVMPRTVLFRRSAVKALTYRVIIMCLDFGTIYLFTGAVKVAIGFMLASNAYTTVAYVLHERAWTKIKWGVNEA